MAETEKKTRLNIQQKAFCREYARTGNGFQSYMTVYGPDITKDSCEAGAYRLLGDERVQQEVANRQRSREARLDISADRILQEVIRLALFNPKKMFRPDGTLMPIHEMDDDVTACISQLEFGPLGTLKKVRAIDKNPSLEKLGKYFKLFIERHELTGADGGPIKVEEKVSVMKAILEEIEAQPHGLGQPKDNGGAVGVAADDGGED